MPEFFSGICIKARQRFHMTSWQPLVWKMSCFRLRTFSFALQHTDALYENVLQQLTIFETNSQRKYAIFSLCLN